MKESGTSENRARYYLRVLRPLFYWFIFVLILFGIRTHERLMEKTRLYFDLTLAGKQERFALQILNQGETPFGATATFDGKPILTGEKIPLGRHTFTITHPKTIPFSTNLFIWYGAHDFGVIDLKRARGTLTVIANPPAPLLFIHGPEYGLTLTNTPGTTIVVPTDAYDITAQYQHWRWHQQVQIGNGISFPLTIAPKFGVLELSCNQSGATYQLSDVNGDFVQSGDLPAAISDLPEGIYKLVSWHHSHEWKEQTYVRAGDTNNVPVSFQYGTAILESTPPGAAVFDSNGLERGVTPLTLSELQPGTWKFNLQLYNYEPATVTFSVAGNETNTYRTNLVSQSYTGAMRTARRFMNEGQYDEAAKSLADALLVQPGDAAATALQKEAVGLGCMARAENLGKQGDYIGGIAELEKALKALPDYERARQMLADFKQHEPEQLERMRTERLNRGKQVFETIVKEKYPDGGLFETHEMKTSKPLKEIELPLLEALKAEPLKFDVTKYDADGLCQIEAVHEFNTVLATSAGRRQLVMIGAQTKDDETQILFKVLEYKAEAKEKFSIGSWIGAPANVNLVPIRATGETNKLQLRLAEGVSNVTTIIEGVIGRP
jgi:tetratricopeptide (TPR) repeat protein